MTGASPRSRATRAPSSVADIGRMRKLSRKPAWRSICEGKPQIGIERALVELVEQHRADAGKLGIVKDHASKDALGDDLDPCLRPAISRPSARAIQSALRRPPTRCAPCARRRPARRCGAVPAPGSSGLEPAFVNQREWHARRLARRRAGPRGRPMGARTRRRAIRPGRRQSEAVWQTSWRLYPECVRKSVKRFSDKDAR